MKITHLVFSLSLTAGLAFADKQAATDLDPFDDPGNAPAPEAPADPFGAIEDYEPAPGYTMEVDRVIFACPSNAVGNILKVPAVGWGAHVFLSWRVAP